VEPLQARLWDAIRRQAAAACSLSLPEQPPADADLLGVARQSGLDGALLNRALAQVLGVEVVEDLPRRPASAQFIEQVPIGFARRHGLLGLASENGQMPVAVADLESLDELQVLARYLGRPVRPLLAPAADIAAAVSLAYQQRNGEAQTLLDTLDTQDLDRGQVLDELRSLEGRQDLLDTASRSPVIRLVNLILFEAVKAEASDVHVQPYEQRLVVRLRIDGLLYDSFEVPKGLQDEVVSRIKVLGQMNIAERRLAQDGRATVQVGDRVIDLRIASLPTSFGERVVIRLLDKSVRLYQLPELGMEQATLAAFRELISAEHGILLVTGPTGSGKTTTLYAALAELNRRELNILTLEDPIEYGLEGISQTQVSERKGMTFASGLRNVLRQDPDVIMVGEIRDRETATMAIQSALTGHLVFSTLHTNDAASAVTRLLDLGIEPYLLASSVIGVLAQRLVRQVCPKCTMPATGAVTAEQLARLGVDPAQADTSHIAVGAGCEHCRRTGYRGRRGIFELLVVDEPVRMRMSERATAVQIKSAAAASGMRTLRDDGLAKVLTGVTTADEVLRVTTRSA
jgi:general secretion pathway protein E